MRTNAFPQFRPGHFTTFWWWKHEVFQASTPEGMNLPFNSPGNEASLYNYKLLLDIAVLNLTETSEIPATGEMFYTAQGSKSTELKVHHTSNNFFIYNVLGNSCLKHFENHWSGFDATECNGLGPGSHWKTPASTETSHHGNPRKKSAQKKYVV